MPVFNSNPTLLVLERLKLTFPITIKINIFSSKKEGPSLGAALHLEAEPIRCVRGLKSLLVIGQNAQIGPNPFTPRGRADWVV
jgi:hypothetical protein